MSYSIIVENVYKKYSKDLKHSSRYGLRSLYKEILGMKQNGLELRESEFFSVEDLSFQLNQGDTIGLIGRNGCGKTTTLKMLNGLIKPDNGKIMIRGRVQALIALGAGFNPCLSGRENIYISAATLGLSRKQMEEKIDEIINFSELEDFIDSPVQSYSSGMYARLGFSVAVHLDPDILLIDEILSVGDFAFQNKCFAKMQEYKKRGVTIVLVSHGMTHVRQICDEAIWFDKGKVVGMGQSHEIITKYMDSMKQVEIQKEKKEKKTHKSSNTIYGPILIDKECIRDLKISFSKEENSESVFELDLHDSFYIHFELNLMKKVDDLNISLAFYRKDDGLHMSTISSLNGDILKSYNEGFLKKKIYVSNINFSPSIYVMILCVHDGKSYLHRNLEYKFAVSSDGKMHWGILDFNYNWINE